MQLLALISGLIGALISGALGFFIRWYLDGRAQRHAEQRIAYVHYLAVSELIAMEALSLNYLREVGMLEIYRNLSSDNNAFAPSHRASVIISKAVHNAKSESLRFPTGHSFDPRLLKFLLDSLNDSKVTNEALSKLPRATIQSMVRLLSAQSQVAMHVEMWTELVEKGDRSWVTPAVVHEQWLAINRLFSAAKEVKVALIGAGVISEAEAERLHNDQVLYQARLGFGRLLNEMPIAAAAQFEKNSEASE